MSRQSGPVGVFLKIQLGGLAAPFNKYSGRGLSFWYSDRKRIKLVPLKEKIVKENVPGFLLSRTLSLYRKIQEVVVSSGQDLASAMVMAPSGIRLMGVCLFRQPNSTQFALIAMLLLVQG